jgi:hypothetical protein
MNAVKSASFGLAMVALAGATALALPASAASMAAQNKMKMHSCMAMSSDAMMADASCMAMMKKMHMSDADMKMMMSCKAMSHDAMMADKGCASMMKKHPSMMKMSTGAM